MARRPSRQTWRLALAAAAVMAAAGSSNAGSSVKADEEVLFLPTCGAVVEEGRVWRLPVHAWVFEREHDSLWRSAMMRELLQTLELGASAAARSRFRQRAWAFLVDSEQGTVVRLGVAGLEHRLPPTGADGHARGELLVARERLRGAEAAGYLEVSARLPPRDRRRFSGRIWLVPPHGLSVVSDIDDTIKVSEVLERRRLVANTFLDEHRTVPGMAALYSRWAAAGAVFHYLSASPWQLYPALAGFLEEAGFPGGSFHLRQLRLKDGTFLDLLESPAGYKTAALEDLLGRFPERRFVLVGDSAEQDPEIYSTVANDHPGQVVRVLIREVPGDPQRVDEIERLLAGHPGLCTVFRDPSELAAALDGVFAQ